MHDAFVFIAQRVDEDLDTILFHKERAMDEELTTLKNFFREVAELTLDHDIINGSAVVFPSRLGKALEKVNPEWWKDVV